MQSQQAARVREPPPPYSVNTSSDRFEGARGRLRHGLDKPERTRTSTEIFSDRMRYVALAASGLRTSVLGFGCSAVMGRVGRKQSLRALHAAYDVGITFFDTARSYGYGESETLLGEFLQGRRDRVILATKFGIVPVRHQSWKRALKPVVRTILDVVPSARRIVRKQVNAQFRENQFTRDILQSSLEESLRKLRTDYVDILFMHSAPVSVLAQSDLLEGLARLIASGKIRMAGISADPDVIATALDSQFPPLTAMQFPVNLFDLTLMQDLAAAQHRGLVFVANHPFGGTERVVQSRDRLRALAVAPAISPDLRDKLTWRDGEVLPEVILNLILTDTGIQVVVPSMMKMDHLRANVNAVSKCRFTAQELAWIRCSLAQPSPAAQAEARLAANL
jgi:aryl-alcohol dehydrogenase-like predicted oxidoreductase